MPGFTSEEVQAQIQRFLTNQIQSFRTKLGLRDTLAMRDAAYDLLSTALLLRPDSYFYLVWLTSNRLEGRRSLQEADVRVIDELAPFLDFRTKPISTTAELTNAQAAVLELNAGLNSRRAGQGIAGSIGPAVARFQRSTERFIRGQLEPNVVRSGEVVETPEEIRARVASALADIKARHETIFELATALTEAISRYNDVQLPQSVVTDIVGRIQERLTALQTTLGSDSALAESRESMLEILVMRTILAKASTFRAPSQTLAPLAGDPQTVTLSDGSTPGSLTGTISGPFNYDSLSTNLLRVQVGTPPVQHDVTLPGGSNAELLSTSLTFPFSFQGSTRLLVIIDGVIQSEVNPADGPHANASALASVLDALYTGWTVTASGNRMVFTSNSFGDDSSLEIAGGTAARIQFLADLPMESTYTRGRLPEASDIVAAVGAGTSGFVAEEVLTDLGALSGSVAAGAVLDTVLASGSDLILTQNSTEAVSPTTDFEMQGVEPGMALEVVAPLGPGVGTYVITAVDRNTLTLAIPWPTTSTTGGTYEVGPDYASLPVGARVFLSGTDFRNTGFYRVAGGSLPGHLALDRNFPVSPDPELSGSVFTSFLKVSEKDTGPLNGIATFPADAGLTALGFTASATQDQGLADTATTTGIDFLGRGVRAGDILRLDGSPDQTITSVTTDTVTFSPGVLFSASGNYEMVSARYEAWAALVTQLQGWLNDPGKSDLTDFEFQVGRLIKGANPSAQILSAVTTYLDGLDELEGYLLGYVVPEERGILNVIRMLNEQGMDRARDLLVTLELDEFFTMSRDSVSYSTHLIRESATVTREIAPVSKEWKSKLPGERVEILSERDVPYNLTDPNRAEN